jgi:superfamily II DNA or RNA helicase
MKISYHGIFGVIDYDKSESNLFNRLREVFSVLDPNRFMVEAFRNHWWDGRDHVIDKNGKFLRGISELIVREIRKLGGKVEYTPYNDIWKHINSPYVHLSDELSLKGIDLAEHQRKMTRELLTHGGGTVEGVTGSGKTEAITLLIRILLEFTDKVFFLVHRIGLMRNALDRVVERCPELENYCGLLGDLERPDPENRIIFSTAQSLSSVLGIGKKKKKDAEMVKLFKEAGAIIIDECHRVSGNQYINLLSKAPEVPIYQFSGTPEVDDPVKDWTIIGVGGPIVCKVSRTEMESIGFIAEAIACIRDFKRRADEYSPGKRRRSIDWMPKKEKLTYYVDAWKVDEDGNLSDTQVKVDQDKGLDIADDKDEYYLYPDYGRDMLFVEEERNKDIADFIKISVSIGRNPLILCERVAQTYYLRGLLEKISDIKADQVGIVHGSHDVKQRRAIVGEYETGKKPILIASSIFDEGEDIQNVGSVVLASGGASLVKVVQRIGRGVRAKKANMGNWIPIWFPLDGLTPFSREHTVSRIRYLERSEITIEECETDWNSFFRFLNKKYGDNPNRNT